LNEFKNILKTSDTYLKTHMGFYILWQFMTLILLGVSIVGMWMLFSELKNVALIFGI
jgi:hypothetical protein